MVSLCLTNQLCALNVCFSHQSELIMISSSTFTDIIHYASKNLGFSMQRRNSVVCHGLLDFEADFVFVLSVRV